MYLMENLHGLTSDRYYSVMNSWLGLADERKNEERFVLRVGGSMAPLFPHYFLLQ
jgi:hypothetical protein